MKKLFFKSLVCFILIHIIPVSTLAADILIPVGQVVGLELHNNTVTVAALEDGSAAQSAGVQVGDRLLSVDNHTIQSTEDVRNALNQSQGSVRLTVQRGDELATIRVEPSITPDGPMLGIYLRQGVTGIGTVTYYDPATQTFAALGHGVNDASGHLLQMTTGNAYAARVISVRKGKSGEPGQLIGSLSASDPLGILSHNTAQGVFGTTQHRWRNQALPVCTADSVQTGSATILSTISGDTPQEYSVEILKIYPGSRQNGRNMLIRITDPVLLETTGGIVQGMGVSYNKDNQDNSLACRGVWCQSIFSLTTKVEAYQAQVCGTESPGFCDRDIWAKSYSGGSVQ